MMSEIAESTTSPQLTLFAGAFPASRFLPLVSVEAMKTKGGSGPNSTASFASLGRDGSWLKTCHRYVQLKMDGSLEAFLGTWPVAGIMSNGTSYQQQPLVPRTSVIGSSLWPTPRAIVGLKRGNIANDPRSGLPAAVRYWPTPNATDGSKAPKFFAGGNPSLPMAVTLYPTPTRSDATGGRAYSKPPGRQGGFLLKEITPGPLNPAWVEWLMGFPEGWTDLKD
jgi:hypothetical protein